MSTAPPLLLKANLKQLRLPTMHAEFEKLAREAGQANQIYEEYLLRLTELAVVARAANALKARIQQASFPVEKDFDTFDFGVAGVPLGIAIAGANTHDQKLLHDTLRSVPIRRPGRRRVRQHLCLDKGYFGESSTVTAKRCGYIPHIRGRGEEQLRCRAGQKPRRRVVEAAHSWTNRARRLLIRRPV